MVPVFSHLQKDEGVSPSGMRALLILFGLTFSFAFTQELEKDVVYPEFAIGPTGIFATIEKDLKVTVRSIREETPAESSQLSPGDILTSIQGDSLAVDDPRVLLGKAIGAAEAKDGTIVFGVLRGDQPIKITVKIPALGGYSPTWPLDCAKSKSIAEATAKFVAESQQEDGSYQFGNGRPFRNDLKGCLASLFLLSTGNEEYLEHVKRHVLPLAKLAETRKNAGGHVNWQLGYQGVLLGEYYLITGDRTVLPGLQELCYWCLDNQAAGGWGHGEGIGPGYVQSGLMNHTGLPILMTLILARECGVEVEDKAYARAVELMYRMTGHGCIAYGDHRSELWWSNTNGRNAMLSCAFSLLNQTSNYRAASEHLATLVTDSYFQPEFGHTGGGFNVMWRGIASVHVPESRAENYRRQMTQLAWYYDLCRQPGGGFSILPTPPSNSRYSGLDWGTGAMGLTYTAPLRTLRITGKPPTKFSKKADLPDFEWGSEADLAFFSTDTADGFGKEDLEPHEIYHLLLKKRKAESTADDCAKYLRHYSPLVRTWAARRLGEMNDAAAIEVLTDAATHSDPRVRRAVFDAISGYDNWGRPMKGKMDPSVVSAKFLSAIRNTLNNPEAAWWEKDGALFALGKAEPGDIRDHFPIIEKYAKHPDWYLREAAFWSTIGLHETITGEEFQFLTNLYKDSRHVFERSSYDAGFRVLLKSDKVAFDRAVWKNAVETLGSTTHEVNVVLGYGTGGIHEAAHRTMMILKHFDPEVYSFMIEDFVRYLKTWEPYYQHSVWLISGSRWQPGILKVLDGLGADGAPVVEGLKGVLQRYPDFDPRRVGKEGQALQQQIEEAIAKWEAEHKA